MRRVARAGWTAIVLVGVATNAHSAARVEPAAPPKASEAQAAQTLDAVIDKMLISIDGSIISLTASEGRMAREIVGANGAVQRTSFVFINDRLGTVADARDAARVTGVFRASESAIEIQYADGSSEIVLANAGGGISIEARAPSSDAYCTSWYPEGHVFSLDERKAALAQYASRLGLADGAEKKPDAGRFGCKTGTSTANAAAVTEKAAAASASPAAASAPAAPVTAPAAASTPPAGDKTVPAAGKQGAAKSPPLPRRVTRAPTPLPGLATAKNAPSKMAELTPTKPVAVRDSEVHLIDTDLPKDSQAQTDASASGALPANADIAAQIGASTCLSVESDGMHWGFRNHCAYTVQFAYCSLDGIVQLTSCKDGAVGGSVAPNGFGVLVADQSLKEVDVAHDFRWVACQGGAGEVIPRLDQTNPPSGRCVR
jgi:hypothetical protein